MSETLEHLEESSGLTRSRLADMRERYAGNEQGLRAALTYARHRTMLARIGKPHLPPLMDALQDCGVAYPDMPEYVRGMMCGDIAKGLWDWRVFNTITKGEARGLMARLRRHHLNEAPPEPMSLDDAYATILEA